MPAVATVVAIPPPTAVTQQPKARLKKPRRKKPKKKWKPRIVTLADLPAACKRVLYAN